jgi:hypothetical protein
MGDIPEDPIHLSVSILRRTMHTHSLRVLCYQQYQSKIVHSQCDIKKLVGVDKEDDVANRLLYDPRLVLYE